MDRLIEVQEQLSHFEIFDYPHTHKLIIDIYHNVYLGSNFSLDNVITKISTNDKYAKWLMEKRDLLHVLFHQDIWFKSEEHSDGDTKYLVELKGIMESNKEKLDKINTYH